MDRPDIVNDMPVFLNPDISTGPRETMGVAVADMRLIDSYIAHLEARVKELDAERRQHGALASTLIGALDELIQSSDGVYGLHMNGDYAPWDSLTEGGFCEVWLISLERAREAFLPSPPEAD